MEIKDRLAVEAAEMQQQLVAWRRQLHQIPELGIHLPQTMQLITQQLDAMGISYVLHEDISCIVATVGSGERCFMLRGDVDALPVVEKTGLSFQSTNGRMHACGHDLHGAILLGAAALLKAHEKELCGTVKLLFQSGEEVFLGAKAALEAGVMENPHVDAGMAMHVKAMLPVGMVETGKALMASADGFKITLTGKGGHGSTPEVCIDPINAAVQVYLALQSLIAREVGGAEEAVLTIGQLAAGDVANVIPGKAVLQGTLRTFQPEVRKRLVSRIRELTAGVAAAYRCQHEYEVLSACPSLLPDEAMTAMAEKSMLSLYPQMQISKDAHTTGSEDFAEFATRIPCAHFYLGAAPEDEQQRYGLHHPQILFNEEALPIGAAVYAKVAMDWLGSAD